MKHSKRDQTLALAGVFQCVSLVQQIANNGAANNAAFEVCLETLFKFDSKNVEDIYGGIAAVTTGLKTLKHQFESAKSERDLEITGYAVSALSLEKKLAGNTKMLEHVGSRLAEIQSQLDYFSLTHDTTVTKLGELYRETISTLGPKIIVKGEQPYLSNKYNASKVRALLLAAVRSAVLWRQCGGSRWQILFGRKSYLIECNRMLEKIQHTQA